MHLKHALNASQLARAAGHLTVLSAGHSENGMRGSIKKPLRFISLALCAASLSANPAGAQSLQNMFPSQGRVLPQVSGGVIAMHEDGAGHFYVLANQGHTIQIFDANGKQTGQIPSASSGEAFEYAADFDVAHDGSVVVADRGTNRIEIFAPDGSLKTKVPVFAPTSIVVLSNGQFAVTTLRTEHPVEIFDPSGRMVRGFGEDHQAAIVNDESAEKPSSLAYTGRIIGDSTDNLYFAVFSTSDPQVRKYDRFGYAAYMADVPAPDAGPSDTFDRFEFGFNFMRLSRSEQINSWSTVGSSGDVHFGANAGLGLAGLIAGEGRGGYGRGGGAGTVAGSISADTSLVQPTFHAHLGVSTKNRGGRGGAGANGGQTGGSGAAAGDSATLQYQSDKFRDGNFSSSNADDASSSTTDNSSTLQYQASDSSTNDATTVFPGTLDYMYGAPQGGQGRGGPGVGGFSSFFLGGLGPRPGGFGRPFSAENISTLRAGESAADAAARTAAGPTTRPDGMGRGRFGRSDLSFAGSIKLNLGRRPPLIVTGKTITAVGVDHQTQEVWTAIGPVLVHLDKYGTPMDTYYITTPEGSVLQASAIVVEPTRLLIGSETGGIYAFARPDKNPAPHAVQAGVPTPKNPAQ
jgi:hypothetical protein